MSTPEEFAAECKAAAMALRRIDKDLRRAISQDVKEEIATPLAPKIGAEISGPYARVLSANTKPRAAAVPTVAISGSRGVVRNGASVNQLVWGTEYGGGKKRSSITRRKKNGGTVTYKRKTTNQFVPAHAFADKAIDHNIDWVLDKFSDIVLKVLDEGVNDAP